MNLVSRLATELKTRMEASSVFPFSNRKNYPPSKQFKPHMLNVASKNNPIIMISPDIEYFEIGNEEAEEKAPQYHILEDAKTIRNPYRGTNETLGSQRVIKDRKKRDYGNFMYSPSNNAYVKEYRTAFSGRSDIWNVNLNLSTKQFERQWNKKRGLKYQKTFRYNEHFGYIERILDWELPNVAEAIDARLVRGGDFTQLEEFVESYEPQEQAVVESIQEFATIGEEE